MKREKIKVILIYLLTLILCGLIIYLIYFIVTQPKQTTKKVTKQKEKTTVVEKCEYNITLEEANQIMNNSSSQQLCEGYNKLIIKDLTLDNKNINFYIGYNNSQTENQKEGIYLQNQKIVDQASTTVKSSFTTISNILYIKTSTQDEVNLLAYNSNLTQIYNLNTTLQAANITDSALTTLKAQDNTINPVVSTSNIDPSSFAFTQEGFTFQTTTKKECQTGQTYKGSNYTVTYNGTFQTPVFVSYSNC